MFLFAGFGRKSERRKKQGSPHQGTHLSRSSLISQGWQQSQYLFTIILGVKLHLLSRARRITHMLILELQIVPTTHFCSWPAQARPPLGQLHQDLLFHSYSFNKSLHPAHFTPRMALPASRRKTFLPATVCPHPPSLSLRHLRSFMPSSLWPK